MVSRCFDLKIFLFRFVFYILSDIYIQVAGRLFGKYGYEGVAKLLSSCGIQESLILFAVLKRCGLPLFSRNGMVLWPSLHLFAFGKIYEPVKADLSLQLVQFPDGFLLSVGYIFATLLRY